MTTFSAQTSLALAGAVLAAMLCALPAFAFGATVCGVGEHANTIMVSNPGKNWIKVETCAQNYNILSCAGASPTDRHPYQVCNQWIEPGAVETLAFDKNVTYMVFEYCVHNPVSIHCLTAPAALEVYGPTVDGGSPFPANYTVAYASPNTQYCDRNEDCPGTSTCSSSKPGVCMASA